MMIEIRRAQTKDVWAIADVKRTVWPDDTADEALITRAISCEDHRTHVALSNGVVVGFVDGFMTTSVNGVWRWEVDLLAVLPQYQGRGIGRRLIEASTEAGRERGAVIARALVQVGNTASQRAFAKCEYKASVVHGLYVASDDDLLESVDARGLYVLPVETCNYVGAWVEGELSLEGLRMARAVRTSCGWDVVGAVISHSDLDLIQAAREAGYTHMGNYQWWTLTLAATTDAGQSPP
jgi:ribosomal protein S18 acetylase RimI-like enzyme